MSAPTTTAAATTEPAATGGFSTVETPNGPFTVIADTDHRVLASGWTDDPDYLSALIHRALRPTSTLRSESLGSITDAVSAYYSGDHAAPSAIPVVQRSGGEFLEKAWDALRKVEAGYPVTYTRFAELAGEPAAVRAAATACARNAAALFVPCHRVKRSDGTLGGFRYGLSTKQWLLDFEAPEPVLSGVSDTIGG
ncbi:methylated-DNA--[protein]-cysteine S-methyltransferase [Gordonia sp. zg691]|uniref:Methylated-DNA--[protein]-cysteine S-methyltransferase n=1 Tax=Gordonia jinghuaiqii TaxID=2758710 RepID=A0A7D7QVC6_9ACTN|nr:methylated-DNA--[protein]-cysteine S-methyltransferase [Gordonia jinghuaiqii]MBD0859660.1 methylated-DNA--[protein]-cysteine S-methyltransferase [Gordonia jinghuaiqii]MCR5976884.1 methylated-DNA--[protein]-cysteine S-methyltransferase [Gordonia jinghuaiqii]QMT00489.1 methylated-DNA--[protein]-cysteine S-methyltransferase [Gordonia jinghuaiqii]